MSFSLLLVRAGRRGQDPSSPTEGEAAAPSCSVESHTCPGRPALGIYTCVKLCVFKSLLTWIFCHLRPKKS